MDTGHWQCGFDFEPEDWFGFIYRIINVETGQHYLGKKQLRKLTRKKVAGRKNRKHVYSESTWRKYTGSSTHLNADIEKYGKDKFIFIIESLHKTKGSLYYAEVEIHVKENVLRETMECGTKKYYNRQISSVKFIPPEETLEESQHKNGSTIVETSLSV
ncbi:MAG: hypothetical protein KJO69_09200 [Gammaproteobacteria bacterium]|nr:hypothetical protein [Gammaproteobacteria bacterium]